MMRTLVDHRCLNIHMRHRRRTRVFRCSLSVLVLCVVSLGAACTEVGREGFVKAAGIDVGDRESHVLEIAGPPTRKSEPSPDCAAKGGKYELVYEIGVKWFGG